MRAGVGARRMSGTRRVLFEHKGEVDMDTDRMIGRGESLAALEASWKQFLEAKNVSKVLHDTAIALINNMR